ncbi:MAG: PA2778 family cysteine peptidase [Alcanivoracaceae bacterium]|nr:PA2778 family cysteine peptidase [Alcanivoracaceae bacterium]
MLAAIQGRLCATLLMLSWLLGGCQSQPPAPHDNTSTRLSIPFFAQQEYQCGPAALASMLHAADAPVSPDELVSEVWLPERRGSLAMELAAAARARGRLVYPVNSEAQLLEELDAGHPVLVRQNLLFSWWPQWHFAVVTGYAAHGEELFLHSGTRRDLRVDRDWFMGRWGKADNEGFVVLREGELPARSDATRLLHAIEDVRRSSQTPALSYWQAALMRYPDDALLHFAHGNALYQAGDTHAARNAFARAVALQPGLHAGWNNLASVLHELGQGRDALDAVTRALELAPANALYLETRSEILSAR